MHFNRSEILTLLILVTIVLSVAALAWYFGLIGGGKNSADAVASQSLSADESHTYTSLAGESLDLRQYDNEIRIVNNWASWSPASKQELPALERIAQEYADQGVAVLAINRKESAYTAEAYLNTLPDLDTIEIVLDPSDKFYNTTGGYAMPETVFFDRAGNVVKQHRGEVSYEILKAELESILQAESE